MVNFYENYSRGDNDQALNRPCNSRPARQISSVYEDLFDQLIQGNSLTVPRAHVSISSMKTQWVRWRQKLAPALGFDKKVLESEDILDELGSDGQSVHVRVFLRDKKLPAPIPYSLDPPFPLYSPLPPIAKELDPNAQETPSTPPVSTFLEQDKGGL